MNQPLDADLLQGLDDPEGPAFPHGADEGDLLELDADGLDADEPGMSAEDAADALQDAVAEALDAEDADEFFGDLWKKVRSVARNIAPIISKVAPLLPIPGAGLIGKAADVVGKVAADEADELDALDGLIDVADDAEEFDAAAPIAAGLAIRKGVPNVARLPHHQRKQLVKAATAATRHIARQHGPEAVAALPAIVNQARRTAVRQGLPVQHLPQLVRRTAAKVAQSPQLLRRFARASQNLRTVHPMGGYGTMPSERMMTMGSGRGYRMGRRHGHRSRSGYGYGEPGEDRRVTLRGPVRIIVETV